MTPSLKEDRYLCRCSQRFLKPSQKDSCCMSKVTVGMLCLCVWVRKKEREGRERFLFLSSLNAWTLLILNRSRVFLFRIGFSSKFFYLSFSLSSPVTSLWRYCLGWAELINKKKKKKIGQMSIAATWWEDVKVVDIYQKIKTGKDSPNSFLIIH